MFKQVFFDFLRSFYAPKTLYSEIAADRRSDSWLCVLLYCLIYVAGSIWLYLNGFTPFVEPWIMLPGESYYLIQSFYIIPLTFLMWILGAGVLHVLSWPFGGRGRFKVLFVMTGYSLWAPWYLLIIVDCIHTTPEWLYNTVLLTSMVLIVIGTTLVVIAEEKTAMMPAILASVIAFASIGAILFTYIR